MSQATDDQPTNLDLGAPGGWHAAFTGKSTTVLMTFLFLVVAFALGYLIRQHDETGNARSQENIKAVGQMTEAIAKLDKTQRDTTEAMIWVMTRTQAERERLDLTKPKLVTDMQR